eukprot:5557909-Alexandrium_andersonii.AAC.1
MVPVGPSRSPSPAGQPSPTLSERRARTDAILRRTVVLQWQAETILRENSDRLQHFRQAPADPQWSACLLYTSDAADDM